MTTIGERQAIADLRDEIERRRVYAESQWKEWGSPNIDKGEGSQYFGAMMAFSRLVKDLDEKIAALSLATPTTNAPVADQRGTVHANLCAGIFDHKWLDPECVETGCRSLAGRRFMDRLYEVVHHDDECKAIGGNGDADCTCDAVPLLRELEKVWRLPVGPSLTPLIPDHPHEHVQQP